MLKNAKNKRNHWIYFQWNLILHKRILLDFIKYYFSIIRLYLKEFIPLGNLHCIAYSLTSFKVQLFNFDYKFNSTKMPTTKCEINVQYIYL